MVTYVSLAPSHSVIVEHPDIHPPFKQCCCYMLGNQTAIETIVMCTYC